jgi:hypothetical protein
VAHQHHLNQVFPDWVVVVEENDLKIVVTMKRLKQYDERLYHPVVVIVVVVGQEEQVILIDNYWLMMELGIFVMLNY